MQQNPCAYVLGLSAAEHVMRLGLVGLSCLVDSDSLLLQEFQIRPQSRPFLSRAKAVTGPGQAATLVPPEGPPQRSLAWVKSGENAPVGPAFLRYVTKAAMVAV
jgi:hypothetical protein